MKKIEQKEELKVRKKLSKKRKQKEVFCLRTIAREVNSQTDFDMTEYLKYFEEEFV